MVHRGGVCRRVHVCVCLCVYKPEHKPDIPLNLSLVSISPSVAPFSCQLFNKLINSSKQLHLMRSFKSRQHFNIRPDRS